MTLQKIIRNTDNPLAPPLRVCTTADEARAAALSSVSVTCLDCAKTFPGEIMPEHRCLDVKGRDNAPMQRARAEGALLELEALKRFPIPPCSICNKEDMRPGEQHTCQLSTAPMPHEAIASRWARQGAAAELAAELAAIKEGST